MWLRASPSLFAIAVVGALSVHCSDDTRDVSAVGRFIRLTPSEMGAEPYDMYSDTISAHTLNATKTDFSSVPGYGGYGYLYVPRVPEGEYYLRRESPDHFSLFLVTTATDLDISQISFGRVGTFVASSTTSATSVTLRATNMQGWQAGDELQLVSTNLGIVLFGLEGLVGAAAPKPGATTLDGLPVNFASFGLPLPDASFGDRLSVLHLASKESDEGWPYRAVAEAYETTPFSLGDGDTVSLPSAAFAPIPSPKSIAVEWKSSLFEAHRSEVSPNATTRGATFSVDALPRATDFGDYDVAPDLLVQDVAAPTDHVATMVYANPFPPREEGVSFGLDELAIAHYVFGVDYLAPGATATTSVLAVMRYETTVDAIAADRVLQPKISPPRAPKIMDADAFRAATGVGLMPRISWDPPALGTPTAYGVRIVRLTVDESGGTSTRSVCLILTPHTEVVIPPAVLTPGETYFARIVAIDEPSRKVGVVPFRYQLPAASAEVLTATFSP